MLPLNLGMVNFSLPCVSLHCVVVEDDDDALDMDDSQPHVALGVEEVHDHLALVELEVEEELVGLVEELDVALAVGSSTLEFFSRSASS